MLSSSLKIGKYLSCVNQTQHSMRISIAAKLAIIVVVLYILNVSVLTSIIPASGKILKIGLMAAMLISSAFILVNKTNKYNTVSLLLLGALLLSVVNSDYMRISAMKFAALFLVMIMVGPLITSDRSRQFRDYAWTAFKYSAVIIALLSCAWKFAGLPNLGRGAFTGVMTHCMLLAPYSGMAACLLTIKLFQGKLKAGVLAVICLIPLLLAGSRAAILAFLVVEVLVFLLNVGKKDRFGRMAKLGTIALFLLLAMMILTGGFSKFIAESDYVKTLRLKGTSDTREERWDACMLDFRSKPIFGVGIGVSGNSMIIDEENASVEPGSSYLAVLAMTGMVGVIVFSLLVLNLFSVTINHRQIIANLDVYAVLVFLIVHGLFEGWILSAGNSLCFVFWLTLGRLSDIQKESNV